MINSKYKLVFSFLTLLISNVVFGQMTFVENKGQWPEQVEFKMNATLHQVYFEKDGFTFNLIDGKDFFGGSVHHGNYDGNRIQVETVKAHAYKMRFIDCSENTTVSGQKEKPFYENYFIGNDPEKWASDVKSFQEIYYKELYSAIDLRIYEQEKGFKYDFIVKPGGSADEIQMHFDGVERFTLSNGNLKISTSVGNVIELKPYVYQVVKGKTIELRAEYVLHNKVLSYRILDEINENVDLIIDPSLIFSTYSGATSDNWGFTACSDKLGNVYSGGIIFNVGYPTTLGAFQVDFMGGDPTGPTYLGCDITISKYDPDGTSLLWATHIGGTNSEEMPHSLVVNQLNELVVFGTTGSNDFPVTEGTYDETFNGGTSVIYDNVIRFFNGTDIIVSKLSADGTTLLGSTYVGGTENDGFNFRSSYGLMNGNDSLYYNYADGARGEVIVDSKSDIFVGTSTFSDDFPTLNGFQMNSNGMQEGVVFKLSSDLNQLIWSSYLGGSHDDAIYSLEINPEGETYVAGGTVSNNFPTTTGAYETTFQGGTTDGFVSHISILGDQLLASTYFGSPEYDQAYFVRRDKFNNVFITGQTEATGSTLIQNAVYNTPNSGQFIAKFLPGLSTLDWSTTFGTGNGKPNISITAFAVDICNRVYLSGWGREFGGYPTGPSWTGPAFGTMGMETTSDAEQSITDGQDFYIMVMYGDASALDYATFFGEQHYGNGNCGNDHVDGGTSRFDRMGNIYQSVCASCGTTALPGDNSPCNAFPTTTGVYSEDNGGIVNEVWTCNNAVFRFSFAEDITVADFYAQPLACENVPVQFTNTGIGANYYWEFGDATTSTEENPIHLFPGPGTYDVMLYTIDSNTCNITDTIIRSITIQDQVTQQIAEASICLGEDTEIGVSPEANHSYNWIPTTGLSNPGIANPTAWPNTTTDYILLIDDGICVDTVFQTVDVINIQYQVEALSDTVICEGDTVELSVTANVPITDVIWSTDPGFINVINPGGSSTIEVSPTQETDYYVMTRDSVCHVERQDTATVEIDIPQMEITGAPILCFGDTITLSANLLNGVVSTYSWEPNSIILTGQGTSAVDVNPIVSTWLSVDIENTRSCTVKDSVYVRVDEVDVSYTKTDLLCYNICTGAIGLTYSGISPFSFYWSNTETSDALVNLCANDYYVTVTDSLGCTDTLHVEISEPAPIDIQISNIQDAGCADLWNMGSATVLVTGGTPPYTYLWSNGDTTNVADTLNVGTYSLTVRDDNNCESSISIDISDPSDLVIDLEGFPVTCHDSCNAWVKAIITIESTGPYGYLWNTAETTDSIGGLCSGTYTVTVSDANECKRIRSMSFINPEAIDVSVNLAHQACHDDLGSATALGAGGLEPYTFLWSDNQDTETVTDLIDGNYSVSISDVNGCSDSISFIIQSPEQIVYDTLKTMTNCDIACNGAASLEVQGGLEPYYYNWDNGSTEYNTGSLCMGNHTVTLTDANGCIIEIGVTIEVNPDGIPVVATSNPYSIYSGASSQLQATESEGYSYTWVPDQAISNTTIATPLSTPFSTIMYQVNVTDSLGCTNSDTTIVYVKDVICDEPYIYVPNAFSPNDDGENDMLYVRGEVIEELQFSVYNRWGELVFNTTSINHGWNGVYQDKKVDPAVFVYHLKATCVNKEVFEKQGNITVVK